MTLTKEVNSYKFLDLLVTRMVKKWIALEEPREIPWTPLTKTLNECTVALISSAGLARNTDQPFDQEGEKRNPWWGDPTYRVLPRDTKAKDVKLYHMHINPALVENDLNTIFPLQRLLEMEKTGEIGQAAPNHYSYMGYILEPEVLLQKSVPAIIKQMKADQVDAALLVPG